MREATTAIEVMTSIMDAVAEVVVATSETDEHLAKRMSQSIWKQFVMPCIKQSANGTWITKKWAVDDTTVGAMVSSCFLHCRFILVKKIKETEL